MLSDISRLSSSERILIFHYGHHGYEINNILLFITAALIRNSPISHSLTLTFCFEFVEICPKAFL